MTHNDLAHMVHFSKLHVPIVFPFYLFKNFFFGCKAEEALLVCDSINCQAVF